MNSYHSPKMRRKKLDILVVMLKHFKEHQTVPTLREMNKLLGVVSTSVPRHHINDLVECGLIARDKAKAHGAKFNDTIWEQIVIGNIDSVIRILESDLLMSYEVWERMLAGEDFSWTISQELMRERFIGGIEAK